MPTPEHENQEPASAEEELAPETSEHPYELPVPHLMDAIASASGDILITVAQKSEEEPKLLNYASGEKGSWDFNKPVSRIYAASERSYLTALQQMLAKSIEAAHSHDPNEIAYEHNDERLADETYGNVADEIADFADKLAYINNAEFEKATDVMAQRLLDDLEQGNTVAIYDYRDRSPRYVTVKVLEKVRRILESSSNYSPEESEEMKSRLLYDDVVERLVSRSFQARPIEGKHTKFYVIDDFAVSGTLMHGAISQVQNQLTDPAIEALHADDVIGLPICGRSKNDETKYGKFSIQPVFKYSEIARNHTGVAVAGSWSSTDYGYQNILEHIRSRVGVGLPIDQENSYTHESHRIKGRYEKDADGNYLDPQYAEEYQRVLEAFGSRPS